MGDVLWVPAGHSPLVTRAVCSRGTLYVGCMGPSAVAVLTTVGVLAGAAGPSSGWLPGPAVWRLLAADGRGWVLGPLVGGAGPGPGTNKLEECSPAPVSSWWGEPPDWLL